MLLFDPRTPPILDEAQGAETDCPHPRLLTNLLALRHLLGVVLSGGPLPHPYRPVL